jgi:hypothetical protein
MPDRLAEIWTFPTKRVALVHRATGWNKDLVAVDVYPQHGLSSHSENVGYFAGGTPYERIIAGMREAFSLSDVDAVIFRTRVGAFTRHAMRLRTGPTDD